ncbi:MAG: prepilin-type N-terminal cleavage/methylation domain-containing protein [Candidatus Omnitrophica bacterium]|nr:prepilin-type N-terminal cleavage/methylation domain-containing protein [Candidatus Omnitrophota bacterium]
MKNNKGLTFLEVILAITLLAVVLGGGLILIGHNLVIMKKANGIMVSTALTQYAIQDARNMDLPPVYYDRLAYELQHFQPAPSTNPSIKDYEFVYSPPVYSASAILASGRNMTPPNFFDDWTVVRYIIAYDSSGNPIQPPPITSISTYENSAMELEVIVYVIQNQGDNIISQDRTYMSRNGTF